MNQLWKFHCYYNYVFWEKEDWSITFLPFLESADLDKHNSQLSDLLIGILLSTDSRDTVELQDVAAAGVTCCYVYVQYELAGR
jgi:hypothetical protein